MAQGTASVALGYDNASRRTSLTLPNGIVVEYGYDDDSRLTSLTYKQWMSTLGDLTYAYDAVGQRTSVGGTSARTGLPAALASATYDDANQIATWESTTFTYDDNGNLVTDGVRTYTWDARNQLASLSGPVSASFGYDGFSRRRTKTIASTTTEFLYDGPNPVQELSGGGHDVRTVQQESWAGLTNGELLTRAEAAGFSVFLTSDQILESILLAGLRRSMSGPGAMRPARSVRSKNAPQLLTQLGYIAPAWLGRAPEVTLPIAGGPAASFGAFLGNLLSVPVEAVLLATAFVLLIFLLHLGLRRQWLVAIAFVGVLIAVGLADTGLNISLAFTVGTLIIMTIIAMRFGLLSFIVMNCVVLLLDHTPLTFAADVWYAGSGWLTLAVLTALTVYGFRTALAGRAVFEGMLVRE